MDRGGHETALRHVHTLFSVGTIGALSDGELLDRFTAGTGEVAEVAFAALVDRHGPMVLRVCRSVLRNTHDTQDAFQATFFVLARRAPAIRMRGSLASWLYGVAIRVSHCALAAEARRRRYERKAAEQSARSVDDPDPADFHATLHRELGRLPDSLRAPLVLCYLEGLTHEQTALQLRWPVGTVRSRLARARGLLRQRLERRGMAASESLLGIALATESLGPALRDSTVRASLEFAANRTAAAALGSAGAKALATGVLRTMTISKLTVLGTAMLVSVVLLGGVSVFAQFGGSGFRQRAAQPLPDQNDRQAALARSVEKIQAELDEASRRNAELQEQLRQVKAELETLRANRPPQRLEPAAKQGQAPSPPDLGLTKTGQMKAMAPDATTKTTIGQPTRRANRPRNFRVDDMILLISPRGDKVSFYDPTTDKSQAVRLAGPDAGPLEINVIGGRNIWAIVESGPEVTRIALYSKLDQAWHPQDLIEPAEGTVQPYVSNNLAIYGVGRHVYAFDGKSWHVLEVPKDVDAKRITPVEGPNLVVLFGLGNYVYGSNDGGKHWQLQVLPKGAKAAAPPVVDSTSATIDQGDHLYIFSAKTGKWKDIDTRAVLDEGEEPEDAGPKK